VHRLLANSGIADLMLQTSTRRRLNAVAEIWVLIQSAETGYMTNLKMTLTVRNIQQTDFLGR